MKADDLIEAAKALRRQADKPLAFHAKGGDLFDMHVNCYYCGGHAFAVQAWLDHVIEALEGAEKLLAASPLTRGAS